jgi:hypothetical protein
MAKKSKSEPLPKEIKKPVSDKKQEQAEKKKKALEDRKDVWATKLLAKLLRHTTREFKSQKIYKNEKETLEFVKTMVLPVFRGLNPRDVLVKQIREYVVEALTTTSPTQYYNPLFIPVGEITGIMWADLDDYLDVDLRASVPQPLRVEINAGEFGSTGIFNLQDYQYEATQVNEIYEGIREVIDNDSNAEWNGRVMVRKGFTDDGNADSYFLQFILSAGGQEIPPVESLEESVGFEIPKETQEQRRARLKDVIARKKELASERRKKSKERSMRLRERPKTKEAPATEVKTEALQRQENIKEIMDKQDKLLATADGYFEKGVYDAKELKARIKEITEQTNLALSKFKRGGEI